MSEINIMYTLLAVFGVSLIAFVGIFTLSLKEEVLNKIIPYLIAFSTGSMLGGFFIHILPKLHKTAIEKNINFGNFTYWILFGILFFYLTEKVFHWHHHHGPKESDDCDTCQSKKIKPVGYMILFSDGMHNFLDGVAIAGAFGVSLEVGLITTLLIVLHEIPQEIGDFGVLLNSGFEKTKALWLNFISGLTAVLGAILAMIAMAYISGIQIYFIAVAGGSFIYIALVDLMPELHNKKHSTKKSLSIEFLFVLLGIVLMFVVKFLKSIL